MTTRPISAPPTPRPTATPARTAGGVLLLAALLIAALTWALLRAPASAPVPATGSDVYLSGAVLTQFVTPDDGGTIADGRFEFVHEAGPYPLRIRAELPPRQSGYVADRPISVELLGPDGAAIRRFDAPVGSVAATADEIVLSGRLFDEHGETLWLAARFAR